MTTRRSLFRVVAALGLCAAGAMALLGLAGCATGTTTVLQQPGTRRSFSTIQLVDEQPQAGASPEIKQKFANVLGGLLFRNNVFSSGPGGLALRYKFVQVEKGNQAQRWARHGVASGGEGSMTVEVTYVDPEGQTLARISTKSEIASGVFGGSLDEAIGKAADEVAAYTQSHFQ